jgi:hypothetical protein
MSTPVPIACTLDPADMPARLREIAALGRDALLGVSGAGPAAATLRFARIEGAGARLDAIAAAEAHCCAFLMFERRDEEGAHVLRITAPEEGAFMVDELVAAFGG